MKDEAFEKKTESVDWGNNFGDSRIVSSFSLHPSSLLYDSALRGFYKLNKCFYFRRAL